MAAERADADRAVLLDAVVAEPGQLVDVDEQLGRGEAELQHRDQALAAGQHLGLATAVWSRPIASSSERGAS